MVCHILAYVLSDLYIVGLYPSPCNFLLSPNHLIPRITLSSFVLWTFQPVKIIVTCDWSELTKMLQYQKSNRCCSKHPLPTTQEKTLPMDITTWSTLKSDWLYYLQPKWRSSIQSTKIRPGADCGSDHELLITKFRLKLKKAEKTSRRFRYDWLKSNPLWLYSGSEK